MSKFLTTILPNWLSAAIAIIGFTGVTASSIWGPIPLLGNWQVGWFEFTAICILALCWLGNLYIGRCWYWINGHRPAVRFKRLANEITHNQMNLRDFLEHAQIIHLSEESAHQEFMKHEYSDRLIRLAFKLHQLNIPTPESKGIDAVVKWLNFLKVLRIIVFAGDFEAAKKLRDDLEEEQRRHN